MHWLWETLKLDGSLVLLLAYNLIKEIRVDYNFRITLGCFVYK